MAKERWQYVELRVKVGLKGFIDDADILIDKLDVTVTSKIDKMRVKHVKLDALTYLDGNHFPNGDSFPEDKKSNTKDTDES